MKKTYAASSIFIAALLFFVSPFVIATFAQVAQSNCVVTQIGNPPKNQQPPPGCGTGGKRWPYPTKNPNQYKRIDQGWDLEASQPSDVLAVADGTVNVNHGADPCNGGNGFGDTYPLEVLDKPIIIQGRKYTTIYYGHVQYTKLGHVTAGTPIAKTYHCVLDNGVWLNWLEIGFWSSGPVGQGGFPTQAGLDMEDYLNGTRINYQ